MKSRLHVSFKWICLHCYRLEMLQLLLRSLLSSVILDQRQVKMLGRKIGTICAFYLFAFTTTLFYQYPRSNEITPLCSLVLKYATVKIIK